MAENASILIILGKHYALPLQAITSLPIWFIDVILCTVRNNLCQYFFPASQGEMFSGTSIERPQMLLVTSERISEALGEVPFITGHKAWNCRRQMPLHCVLALSPHLFPVKLPAELKICLWPQIQLIHKYLHCGCFLRLSMDIQPFMEEWSFLTNTCYRHDQLVLLISFWALLARHLIVRQCKDHNIKQLTPSIDWG